jgi:hypothetical protein
MTHGKPVPITRDQEFYGDILEELHLIRLHLAAIALGLADDTEMSNRCEVCGRVFASARGLRAHMKVHKGATR